MIMKEVRQLLRFNVDIVNHCNLNCVGCGHFSPLAKEYYLPLDSFKRDCEQLSKLTGGVIERMEIMGGEPLLHPQLIEFMAIARANFRGEINICTNGILVDKQPATFFEACSRYGVSIAITLYPISLDWNKIESLVEKYKVGLIKVGTKHHERRLWYKNHRDLSGKQNIQDNFSICRWGNNCIFLENGRLATCVMPFKTKYYNDYYHKNTFIVPDSDSIDIYNAANIDEILDFLSKPITCCRYCMPNDDELIDWKVSKKEIEEWS